MRQPTSFFKREAAFIMLFEIAMPILSLFVILMIYVWRWLSR